jgi:hypothetical protein
MELLSNQSTVFDESSQLPFCSAQLPVAVQMQTLVRRQVVPADALHQSPAVWQQHFSGDR